MDMVSTAWSISCQSPTYSSTFFPSPAWLRRHRLAFHDTKYNETTRYLWEANLSFALPPFVRYSTVYTSFFLQAMRHRAITHIISRL
jgi:hypothetical protein